MYETLLILTTSVLVGGLALSLTRTRDALTPMLFIGPLFVYATVLDPWLVRHDLARFFQDSDRLTMVLTLNLFGAIGLTLGALHGTARRGNQVESRASALRNRERTQLGRVAVVLAIVALAAYAYGLSNAGGFVAAFSRVKGGGNAGYGYLNEAMNLGVVASAMVALSRYRQGWTVSSTVLVVMGLLPNLTQGTLGGRRGPLFLALMAGCLAWMIVRRRKPSHWVAGLALGAALLSVGLVASQRQRLYLGSGQSGIDWEAFRTTLTHEEVGDGNNFIYGAAFVLAVEQSGQYTWGKELAVNLLVRPVPRQLWPTKYEDVGATWATNEFPGLGHLTSADWLAGVGWVPPAGSSASSISDLYGEFWWGAVLVMYAVGRLFAVLSLRRQTHGGMWTLLYFEALVLSIYLATQSFSAFYYRYLILAVPTVVGWRLFVGHSARQQSVSLVPVYRRSVRRPSAP